MAEPTTPMISYEKSTPRRGIGCEQGYEGNESTGRHGGDANRKQHPGLGMPGDGDEPEGVIDGNGLQEEREKNNGRIYCSA